MKTKSPKKKPYHPPQIMSYGDLRKLTGVKGGSGGDGSGKPKTKVSGPGA